MADDLDNVFGNGAVEEAPEQSAVQEPVVEAATPEPQEPEQPKVEQPAQEAPEQRQVPFGAMLDERDKRKAAEQERDELRRWKQEREAQVPQPNIPDPFDDPNGFRESIRLELRVETSDERAREKHGDEAVEAATAWANAKVAAGDPSIAVAFTKERSPVEWLVQQHKRDALLSDIGDRSVDDFVRDYLTKNPDFAAQSAPASAAVVDVVPKPASPPVRVPRSLAGQGSAPSDIRQTATGPLAGVDALFG